VESSEQPPNEVAALRARLEALDAERAAETARANAALAELQRRLYWLDRWEVDLDAFAASPAGRLVELGAKVRRRLRTMSEARRARSGG
jgi:hypothetical protein